MKNIIKKILKPAAPALLSVCIAAGALAGCAAPERASDSAIINQTTAPKKKGLKGTDSTKKAGLKRVGLKVKTGQI